MTTYKLFRYKEGKLYPLFVNYTKEVPIGKWITASIGELKDETHVKSRIGPLALRPGFHSTEVPFTDWIGKKVEGTIVQRKSDVWCECEIHGTQETINERNGKPTLPTDWYYYKTKPNQPFPWIISNQILIKRILTHSEVETLCRKNGIEAQPIEA